MFLVPINYFCKTMRMSKIKLILITTLLSSSIIAYDKGGPSPILQPGAPGQQTKSINAEEATNIANSSYTTADVYFMQGMIVHHALALTMS